MQSVDSLQLFVETSIKERVVFVSVVNEGMQAQAAQHRLAPPSLGAIKFLGPVSLRRFFFQMQLCKFDHTRIHTTSTERLESTHSLSERRVRAAGGAAMRALAGVAHMHYLILARCALAARSGACSIRRRSNWKSGRAC
jgi:hypothetical protein